MNTAESQASGSASEGFGFSSDLSQSGAGDRLLMPMMGAELLSRAPSSPTWGWGLGVYIQSWPSLQPGQTDQWGLMRPSGSLKGLGPWPRLEAWPEQLLPKKGELPG